jgi:hypothetical protein
MFIGKFNEGWFISGSIRTIIKKFYNWSMIERALLTRIFPEEGLKRLKSASYPLAPGVTM